MRRKKNHLLCTQYRCATQEPGLRSGFLCSSCASRLACQFYCAFSCSTLVLFVCSVVVSSFSFFVYQLWFTNVLSSVCDCQTDFTHLSICDTNVQVVCVDERKRPQNPCFFSFPFFVKSPCMLCHYNSIVSAVTLVCSVLPMLHFSVALSTYNNSFRQLTNLGKGQKSETHAETMEKGQGTISILKRCLVLKRDVQKCLY